jgi:spore maturation protein CgeB
MIDPNSVILKYLDYPKFMGPQFRVVILDSGYHSAGECRKGLEKLGHQAFTIAPGHDFIKRLLTLLVETRPDFLLAVNHLGFDEEGKLTSILTDLKIPFASWYVDSPTYILYGGERNLSPYCAVFCWERSYLRPVEKMGFHSPVFLPLATDPETFTSLAGSGMGIFASPMSFVGDSMETARKKWEKKLPNIVNSKMKEMRIEALSADRHREVLDIFPAVAAHATCDRSRVDIEAALIWRMTQEYRLGLVRSLLPLGLVIYGDKGWERLLRRRNVLRPPVNYFTELPAVYRGAAVNINCTSFQMKTAVNQRVFDVPACGGFLISDYQEDMDLFFDVGKEAICYRSNEEAVSLAAHYLANETERKRIAEAGRKRVLAEHTYEKRMAELVAEMRRRFA